MILQVIKCMHIVPYAHLPAFTMQSLRLINLNNIADQKCKFHAFKSSKKWSAKYLLYCKYILSYVIHVTSLSEKNNRFNDKI